MDMHIEPSQHTVGRREVDIAASRLVRQAYKKKYSHQLSHHVVLL